MLDDLPPYVTVGQFVELTGASKSFTYRLLRERRLAAIRLGKRCGLRIPKDELRRFLESRSLTRDAA